MFMGLCIIYTDLIFLHKYHFFLDTETTLWHAYTQVPLYTSMCFISNESPCMLSRGFYLLKSIQRQTTQKYIAKVPLNGDEFITINIKIHLTPTNYDICIRSKIWIFSIYPHLDEISFFLSRYPYFCRFSNGCF